MSVWFHLRCVTFLFVLGAQQSDRHHRQASQQQRQPAQEQHHRSGNRRTGARCCCIRTHRRKCDHHQQYIGADALAPTAAGAADDRQRPVRRSERRRLHDRPSPVGTSRRQVRAAHSGGTGRHHLCGCLPGAALLRHAQQSLHVVHAAVALRAWTAANLKRRSF